MRTYSMFWQQIYWLEDCDRDRLLLQIMKIMDLKGIKRRRLERWKCEKESTLNEPGCPSAHFYD